MDFFKPVHHTDFSQLLWTVKYRPRTLDEIVGNVDVVGALKSYLAQKNIPNLIVTGSHGIGKKSAVDSLVTEYLGEYYKTACLSIDGSVNRGKDIVSENKSIKKTKTYSNINVINFIKTKITLPEDMYKIVVIYDFDHMRAQMALRRIIELYSHKVRFIFVANDYSKIIEAVQSRCIILKFEKLDPEVIRPVLERISTQEHLGMCDELFDLIIMAGYGDLKQCINNLQVMSQSTSHSITDFYDIFNIPFLPEVKKMIASCAKSDTETAFKIINRLTDEGYNNLDLLDIIFKLLCINRGPCLEKDLQVKYLDAVGKCYYMTEQSGSVIHLYSLIARQCHLGRKRLVVL